MKIIKWLVLALLIGMSSCNMKQTLHNGAVDWMKHRVITSSEDRLGGLCKFEIDGSEIDFFYDSCYLHRVGDTIAIISVHKN